MRRQKKNCSFLCKCAIALGLCILFVIIAPIRFLLILSAIILLAIGISLFFC